MSSSDPSELESERESTSAAGLPQVRIRPRKEGTFLAGHPWVLARSIGKINGAPKPGDEVEVCRHDGRFIAYGIFNPLSRIRVRLYSRDTEQPLDETFWKGSIQRAISLREQLGLLEPHGACRLIFSEADGLSGLIVDRYAKHLVIQLTSLAWYLRRESLLQVLEKLLQPESVRILCDPSIQRVEGIVDFEEELYGEEASGPLFIEEHGIQYGIDLQQGQKTGFYLDQRDNRREAAAFTEGKEVLDICCYSGGFSLCAAKLGGAASVLGVDTSQRAVDMARANAELNELRQVQFEAGDAFKTLDNLQKQGRTFDVVMLDPPKFAGSHHQVPSALRAYHRLNRLGVSLLKPEGILITSSCSGHVTAEDFQEMLAGVSQKSRREIQVLQQKGAAPDHPVLLGCPETAYLKCFFCRAW
ncbi:Ribosomal RNA large subunit methyltransferase I [Planctomycetales bacterium 10988]|nr:Ribosomal RNA large subunit methyltransferase I [Planctomycetales bacterium 10988]